MGLFDVWIQHFHQRKKLNVVGIIIEILNFALGLATIGVGTSYNLCRTNREPDVPESLLFNGIVFAMLSGVMICLLFHLMSQHWEDVFVRMINFFLTCKFGYIFVSITLWCVSLRQTSCMQREVQLIIVPINLGWMCLNLVLLTVFGCYTSHRNTPLNLNRIEMN